ncbi:MAG: tetratricopeptide repeat protein [Candidatus Thiodiazotropha sp.]
MRYVNPRMGGIGLALLISACSNMTAQTDQSAEPAKTVVSSPLAGEIAAAERLYQANKVERARAELQALIDANPKRAEAYRVLAGLELEEAHPETAQNVLEKALALEPNNPQTLNQLGVAQRMQGRFSEAEQAYTQALAIDPDYAQAHRNLGILYDLYLGKPGDALNHYQRSQALNGASDAQLDGWIADLKRRTGTQP